MKISHFWAAMLLPPLLLPMSALASKCSLGAVVLFAPNSVALDEQGLEKALAPVPLAQQTNTVLAYIISAHADATEATGEKAKLLSLARAGSVASHVMRQHPELADTVQIESYGSGRPVSANPDGNRRAEIEVVCVAQPPYFDALGRPRL